MDKKYQDIHIRKNRVDVEVEREVEIEKIDFDSELMFISCTHKDGYRMIIEVPKEIGLSLLID